MLKIKNDIGNLGWDSSSFPILCEKCLGNSPYLRMIKNNFQNECKICKRPFTVFTWKPDANSRNKKTEICPTCAKLKNVCQTCLFDLQFGLPVELRDKFLKKKIEIPKEQANLDYFISKATETFENLNLPCYKPEAYKLSTESDIIKNIIEKKNNSKDNKDNNKKIIKRNQRYICTFFLRGECNRGDLCPYRHEIPEIGSDEELIDKINGDEDKNKNENKNKNDDDNINDKDDKDTKDNKSDDDNDDEDEENNKKEKEKNKKQGVLENIKARYMGIDDPVARKIIKNYSDKNPPEPPKDKNIKTIVIHEVLDESIKEKDVVNVFAKYGELKQVKLMISKGNCIYVTFGSRKNCEKCINELFNKCYINDEKYRLTWAKINDVELFTKVSKEKKIDSDEESDSEEKQHIQYKIECPQYNPNINKNIAIKSEENNNKLLTVINLTSYDNGEIPYYASIDPKNKGGILKKKRNRFFDDL